MKNPRNAVDPAAELLNVVQSEEVQEAIRHLLRAIDSLPADGIVDSEFLILLDLTRRVCDSWAYLSEHPEELEASLLGVLDPE